MANSRIPSATPAFKTNVSSQGAGGLCGSYEHHVVLDHVVPLESAPARTRFEGISSTLRDMFTQQWLRTQQTYDREDPKRVYYLSMEFLIGRTLCNNIMNLGLESEVAEVVQADNIGDWSAVLESEPDAGLGKGGLGRLAACFIESLATMSIPAVGYGLRYEYGIFRQSIQDGYQVEQPDQWLTQSASWEIARSLEAATIPVNCTLLLESAHLRVVPGHPSHLPGIPYDRPVVGYGGKTINTLRLWSAASPDQFDFGEFSSGDFVGAIVDRVVADSVTRVLYPDDSTVAELMRTLLDTDYYMHLADLTSYASAQEEVGQLHANRKSWLKRAILNVASSGKFSSDRAIGEYATEIWNAQKCPVES